MRDLPQPSVTPPTYTLRFFFAWLGGCLWPGSDAAYRDLGLGPYDTIDPCPVPLSPTTLRRCEDLAKWHDTSLNWDSPTDPGPWRQEECVRFNEAVARLVADVSAELGPNYAVIDRQQAAIEDPDLDAYLADPQGFRRTGE